MIYRRNKNLIVDELIVCGIICRHLSTNVVVTEPWQRLAPVITVLNILKLQQFDLIILIHFNPNEKIRCFRGPCSSRGECDAFRDKSKIHFQFNGRYKQIEDDEFSFEHCRGGRFIYKGIFERIRMKYRQKYIIRWSRAYQTFKRASISWCKLLAQKRNNWMANRLCWWY